MCNGATQYWIDVHVHGKYGRSLTGRPVYEKSFTVAFHVAPGELQAINSSEYPIIIGMDFGRTPAAVLGQRDWRGRVNILDSLYEENVGLENFLKLHLKPLLTNKFVLGALTTRAPMLVRPIAKSLVGALNTAFFDPRLNALMKEIEKALGQSKWFAGDTLTAADIVMGYCMELAAHRAGMDEARFPNGHRFLKQMREYPSYIRAIEKDGKGTILL
jgi:hypothetical protein